MNITVVLYDKQRNGKLVPLGLFRSMNKARQIAKWLRWRKHKTKCKEIIFNTVAQDTLQERGFLWVLVFADQCWAYHTRKLARRVRYICRHHSPSRLHKVYLMTGKMRNA
jgi:hypothetical protein